MPNEPASDTAYPTHMSRPAEVAYGRTVQQKRHSHLLPRSTCTLQMRQCRSLPWTQFPLIRNAGGPYLPMGALIWLMSKAGKVRSGNHSAPPSARPGQSEADMRRMAQTQLTKTGNCAQPDRVTR